MRIPAGFFCFLALLALSTSGCSQSYETKQSNKLVGVWQMDETDDLHEEMVGETMEDRAEDLNASGEKIDTQGDFVAAKLEIEFSADGQLRTTHIMLNKPYEKQGSWELPSGSKDGDHTEKRADVITVCCDLPSGETTTEITFVDDDTILMIPPNFDVLGKEHTFKRVK